MATIGRRARFFNVNIKISTCYGREPRVNFTTEKVSDSGDPLDFFLRKDVQMILKRITGFDPQRAFTSHKVSKIKVPQYKVLTDEELKKEMKFSERIVKKKLQMPPFMDCRKPRGKLLATDKELQPILDSKFVFVDISENTERIKDYSSRPIVCRHKDGSLKEADWEMFERVSQIYFPVRGREIYPPKMFEEKNLEEILNKDNYLYILERACVQYEPDHEDFIRITRRIYEHIAENNCYDCLRSTRFFGPMSFYFVWINKIEPLLADMINRDLLIDAIDLIILKRIVNQQSILEGDVMTIIKEYYLKDSNQRHIGVLREALDKLDKRLEAQLNNKREEAC